MWWQGDVGSSEFFQSMSVEKYLRWCDECVFDFVPLPDVTTLFSNCNRFWFQKCDWISVHKSANAQELDELCSSVTDELSSQTWFPAKYQICLVCSHKKMHQHGQKTVLSTKVSSTIFSGSLRLSGFLSTRYLCERNFVHSLAEWHRDREEPPAKPRQCRHFLTQRFQMDTRKSSCGQWTDTFFSTWHS